MDKSWTIPIRLRISFLLNCLIFTYLFVFPAIKLFCAVGNGSRSNTRQNISFIVNRFLKKCFNYEMNEFVCRYEETYEVIV